MIRTRNQKNDSFSIGFPLENNNIYYEPITYQLQGGKIENKDIVMGDILQGYYDYLCGEYPKKNTKNGHYYNAKRFIEYTHGNINADNVQQWRIYANNHYKRHNSLNANINSINVFLKWINKAEHCMKTVSQEESSEYSLDEKEYDKLKASSRDDLETALILELLSHLVRPQEIIDIKMQNRDKDVLYLEDTKTGNNHIIMSPELQELWDRYLTTRPIPLEDYKDYLLIDNESKWRGYKYKTTLPIRNKIEKLGHKANIDKKVKPYTVKRTCITLMLDKDSRYFTGDPLLVQMRARHKKLETTMRYNRKDESYIRKYLYDLNNIGEKNAKSLSDEKQYRAIIV